MAYKLSNYNLKRANFANLGLNKFIISKSTVIHYKSTKILIKRINSLYLFFS